MAQPASGATAAFGSQYKTLTHTTGGDIKLLLGQDLSTSIAISGIKIRFRARIFEAANIDFWALDLGVQS